MKQSRIQTSARKMVFKLILPMSGLGKRFVAAGYTSIKPMIEVEGKPIIQHVMELFPGVDEIHCICREEHRALVHTFLSSFANLHIHYIPGHSLGPVYAVMQVAHAIIGDDDEILVSYCDYGTEWNFAEFLETVHSQHADGAIAAYKGFHPHMLGTDNYAFLRLDDQGNLAEIREKEPFTDNRMSEYASNGTYYFRRGAYVKKYFGEVLASGDTWSKNGEYYVSLVYNLLVRDGLRVIPFEIQKMLQWGTPKDLEEYNVWSRHFHKILRQPTVTLKSPESSATLVLPMAGRGSRFSMVGYETPKPLLDIRGKPMIVRAVESIPRCERNVFVCLNEHLQSFPLAETLRNELRDSTHLVEIVGISDTTEGQACTCQIAIEEADILPSEPILISACDNGVDYDEAAYAALEADESVDVIVWSFTNNPTSQRFPHMYAWMTTDEDLNITKVSVKKYLEGAKHCIIGTMFFRRAAIFQEGLGEIVEKNIRTNGEFYVDDLLNPLIAKGYKVKVFPVDAYICWGTPTDYQVYQYWLEYFGKKLNGNV